MSPPALGQSRADKENFPLHKIILGVIAPHLVPQGVNFFAQGLHTALGIGVILIPVNIKPYEQENSANN
jgi:hypothetical protein